MPDNVSPLYKKRYPTIIQITTSMNCAVGDEYIYGLDSDGNLWVMEYENQKPYWQMFLPADRDRKKKTP